MTHDPHPRTATYGSDLAPLMEAWSLCHEIACEVGPGAEASYVGASRCADAIARDIVKRFGAIGIAGLRNRGESEERLGMLREKFMP